jgi:hypothetical protein
MGIRLGRKLTGIALLVGLSVRYSSHRPGIFQYRKMATASTIQLTSATQGSYHVDSISSQSLSTASSLLQKNHEQNHMYFNDEGFHNHIVHHLLTILSLGATPNQIQTGFNNNNAYQVPQKPTHRNITSMSDPANFNKHLGKQNYFTDYLTYFTSELDSKGLEAALNEHLFADTPYANDMLKRMYSGFYHPIIHLGFGLEYDQPAIVAEALAQAATHDIWINKLLAPVSDAAAKNRDVGPAKKSLVQLIHEARKNEKLATSPDWNDGNKVRDGVIARAADEMIPLASQWYLPRNPSQQQLDRATAEMYNAAVYFTGLAQRRGKEREIDFYFMHCTNSAIFFPIFMNLDFIPVEKKREMLEYKAWIDLAMYVSRRTPELLAEVVKEYKGKQGKNDSWDEIFKRIDAFEDDGHGSKLIRTLARGEQVSKPFETEGEEVFPVHGDMWLKLANLVADSVNVGESTWVRSAGFDQAWEKVPDLEEKAARL